VKELEERIQELERQLAEAQDKDKASRLEQENEQLRALVKRLAEENRTLQQSQFTFELPLSAARTPPRDTPLSTNELLSPIASATSEPSGSLNVLPDLANAESSSHSLRTPPEPSLDEGANTVGSDFDPTLALQQVLGAAATSTSLSRENNVSSNNNLGASSSYPLANLNTSAALAALVSATHPSMPLLDTRDASQTAPLNTQNFVPTTNDVVAPASLDSVTQTLALDLLAGQLFPPLAPNATSNDITQNTAAPVTTPAHAELSSTLAALATAHVAGTGQVNNLNAVASSTNFASFDLNSSLFSQYREPNSLATLMTDPAPVNAAATMTSTLSLTSGTDNTIPPQTAIMPLEQLPISKTPMVMPCEKQLEEYCAAGVLDEKDLDFLCEEMKKKCRAAKEAAVAKLERLKREKAEQERLVAHAIYMSSQLDAINTAYVPK
jgi:hypothetical protein